MMEFTPSVVSYVAWSLEMGVNTELTVGTTV